MQRTDDVTIVFADLEDAKAALDAARGSPRDVRRCFSRYAELSQRLTSVMRKQFSSTNGRSWKASSFPHWTKDTALLKYARTQDQHATQVRISVEYLQYFSFSRFFGVELKAGDELSFSCTSLLEDQLLETNPPGVVLSDIDPTTGKSTTKIEPHRVDWRYLLMPQSDEERAIFAAASSQDVHQVVASAHSTLTRYVEFFRAESDA